MPKKILFDGLRMRKRQDVIKVSGKRDSRSPEIHLDEFAGLVQ